MNMASFMPEKSHQKSLKCGICLETLRNPRDLPCLHSFCVECLEGWVKKSDKEGVLGCPTCMEETPVPKEGVQGLPVHETNIQDTADKETESTCGNCDTPGKLATVHCFDCKESMCKECNVSHGKIKALQDHQVVPIEDVESGKAKKLTDKKNCTKHVGEPNKFYCQTCEKLVCRDCIVMKQCCRDHDYVTMQEAAEKQAGNVKKALELCKEAEKKIIGSITECEKVESDAKKSKAKLQQCLVEVQNAYEVGDDLKEDASYFEIVSKYDEIKQTLDRVSSHSTPAEMSLQGFQYPTLPSSKGLGLKKQWKQVGLFDVGSHSGITIDSDNDIVISHSSCSYSGTTGYYMKVLSRSGAQKSQFKVTECFSFITPANDGTYVVPSLEAKCIKTYDTNERHETSSFPVFDMDKKSTSPSCATVDNSGNFIIGTESDTVSIVGHQNFAINKFKTDSQTYPIGITVTQNKKIAVIFNRTAPYLRIFDYSGNILKNSQPPPELMICNPVSICSSTKGELFILNSSEACGIYIYTWDGDYMGCVTTRLGSPKTIALSPNDQELLVDDSDKIKIFQRPY